MHPIPRNALLLAAASVSGLLALELPWNGAFLQLPPSCLALELGIISLLVCGLFFACGRRKGGPIAAILICFGIGLAQHYMSSFKGTAILPSDLMSLGTAAAVAGGYDYTPGAMAWIGLAAAVAGIVACSFISKPVVGARRGRARAANLGATCVCALVLAVLVSVPDYEKTFDVSLDGWDSLASYEAQGFLPSFVEAWQHMDIAKPSGYSDEEAQALEKHWAASYEANHGSSASRGMAHAQFDEVQPNVIVVMNETFSDLSDIYNGLGADYEGPQFFQSLEGCLVRGRLAVSAYAGGTCNTEFEFLCGSSLAYVGSGKYPYTLYDLENCWSLPETFKQLGYTATAIHPNLGTNWGRNEVYAGMGFDDFLTIDDFADAPTFHSGVTDKATYEAVLDLITSSDDPQFVFDVTMQNHSGYDQKNIPSSRLTSYSPAYLDEGMTSQLNEYLSCIEASDDDLEWLIGQLEALDEPCVVIFFGDHQPSVSGSLNSALYPDEEEPDHGSRGYQTNYFVWANYDVADAGETRAENASSSSLAAVALDAIGAPLTSWQESTLAIREQMPMLNLFAFCDTDGDWHSANLGADNGDASEAATSAREAFEALARIQYRNFATKVQ